MEERQKDREIKYCKLMKKKGRAFLFLYAYIFLRFLNALQREEKVKFVTLATAVHARTQSKKSHIRTEVSQNATAPLGALRACRGGSSLQQAGNKKILLFCTFMCLITSLS